MKREEVPKKQQESHQADALGSQNSKNQEKEGNGDQFGPWMVVNRPKRIRKGGKEHDQSKMGTDNSGENKSKENEHFVGASRFGVLESKREDTGRNSEGKHRANSEPPMSMDQDQIARKRFS